MPWGLKIDDKICFSTVTLNDYPDHSAVLGRIGSSFSLIESLVGSVYGILKHQAPEQALAELKKMRGNADRVWEVQKHLQETPPSVWSAETASAMDRVLDFAQRRNKIAHGIWGAVEEEKDVLYHIPVKKLIMFIAPMFARASEGRPTEGVDDLKTQMSRYTLYELSALEKEAEELVVELFTCFSEIGKAAAVAAGWEQIVDRETGEPGFCSPATD